MLVLVLSPVFSPELTAILFAMLCLIARSLLWMTSGKGFELLYYRVCSLPGGDLKTSPCMEARLDATDSMGKTCGMY